MGIVMERRHVDQETAFRILSHASQDTNIKLRVLAEEVVRSGNVSELATR